MNRRDDISGDLSDVRRDIDDIDDRILELLVRRFRAVRKVREIKGLDRNQDGSPLRPARESQVIRRLVAASDGELSPAFVAGLWYEIMAAASRLQAPIDIHVVPGPDRVAYQDLVRFHAGAELSVTQHVDVGGALDAVQASARDIVMCAWSETDGEAAAIGRKAVEELILRAPHEMRIIGKLPFVAGASPVEAIVIGKVPFQPSGDDMTFLAVEGGESNRGVVDRADVDITFAPFVCCGGAWSVYRINGHVEEGGEQAESLKRAFAARDTLVLGGYARPIDPGVKT